MLRRRKITYFVLGLMAVLATWLSCGDNAKRVVRRLSPRLPLSTGERSLSVSGPDGSTDLFVDVRRVQESPGTSVFVSIAGREALQSLRFLVGNDDDGDGVVGGQEWQVVAESAARTIPEGKSASLRTTIGVYDAYRVQEVYSDYAPANTDQSRFGVTTAE